MSLQQIRLAIEADRDHLKQLFLETNTHYQLPEPDPHALERAMDRLLSGGDPRCWIAISASGAAGYLVSTVVYPPVEGAMFVKELYVADRYRGDGIGPQLLAEAADTAVSEGCVRLDLTTDRGNSGAMRFYPRVGGVELPEKAFFRFEGGLLEQLAQR